ncbi:zinc-ribbon and DUF3426 domain-containing protein [Aquincola sp. J276]|uniref:zinc-ribbon and DUF3426 domain-containing protein n=1 Tax=Aquincola sp. J276 TaxID=2898432 RepID=UPI0021510221|nr:zinc-ribbon and DUF3426 domain-containing protein [Aquincola sp. J276]MCR5866875.1 zinc-ribbon domain-containing protein [Aquincola sp. J276]
MSLATRCAQCGTVFRVVEDQLKVSEGWVRCGRCEAVFNALESLFDLEQETPPPWPGAPDGEPPAPQAPQEPLPAPRAGALGPLEPPPFEPSDLPGDDLPASARLDHRPLLHQPDDEPDDGRRLDPRFQPTQAPQEFSDDEPDDEPFRARSAPLPMRESPPDLVPPPAARPAAAWADPAPVPPAAAAAAPARPATPEFMRRPSPRQAGLWQRPGVRGLLVLAAVLLALLLLAQIGLRWRDALAARWPESAPVLHALCGLASCQVEPLRRVDSLAVDSSGLVKLEGHANSYEFNATLRNNDRVPVMLPAFELTLTDAQGQVVSRKVLSAAAMGASGNTLAAGSTLKLQGVLAGGERKLTGYTVEIFYP